jgi:orotate phosphoribosyltransferase
MFGMFYTQAQIDAAAAAIIAKEKEVTISFSEEDMFSGIRVEGDFTLTSGRKSNYFYDFEKLAPNYMTFASGLLHEKLRPLTYEFVVGPMYGGIIPAYCVADFSNVDFMAFDPKTLQFRGQIKRNSGRYIIVDDVVSTYGTVDAVIKAMPDVAKCVGIGTFVFRGDKIREELPTYYLHRGEIEL